MGDRLTDDELSMLATLFPPGPATTRLLVRAGFSKELLPLPEGTSRDYWDSVNDDIAAGMVTDGRARVLRLARVRYPDNDVLLGQRRLSRARILFLGASPDGVGRVRADREFRAVERAAEAGALELHHRPAARPADLDQVRVIRPDILHLACHGDGRFLIFENAVGGPLEVDAGTVADTLRTYQTVSGAALRGLVLNACRSATAAELLRPWAGAVVAHRADLDDDCAVTFSEELYRVLGTEASLRAAASVAAQNLALASRSCEAVRDNLVLLGEAGAAPDGR